ncbi:putative diguanylate cyclase YcdT [Paenibacillus konkukensis]|uniref:Diguanylate cyclase YcdT n=2 Tax=Paenibacillus konkukensis TaxID=2020716 RepID=A0ABY4RP77_9BACL|nr:putative diguanylate cyclase YcdT [Paenibacillus konkukensis]
MNHLLLELANMRQTYRKMLNLYWITIVLTVALEYCIHQMEGKPGEAGLLGTLLLQAVGLAAITGITEMLYRYRKVQSDDLMIITGILYASSIIYVNPTIGIVPAIYIFPILTSVLSFNKKRILAAFSLTLVCFAVMYAVTPELRASMQPIHVIGTLFLYVGTTIISLNISVSGIELLNNLRIATEAKQELLVKNVIMDKLSKMDALTDLYNHKTFHEYLEKLVEQHERNHLALQLAILDIDNFKKINDTYGHWVGDIVLQRVANIIKETVTPNDFVVRYGGEEFAVIFTEKTIEQALRITEQIRQKLSVTIHPELDSQAVTISIGLHEYVRGEGKEALFKGADASLYSAKRTGKNKTVVQSRRGNDPKGV